MKLTDNMIEIVEGIKKTEGREVLLSEICELVGKDPRNFYRSIGRLMNKDVIGTDRPLKGGRCRPSSRAVFYVKNDN